MKRDAEHHLVMTELEKRIPTPKPKPVKADKKGRRLPKSSRTILEQQIKAMTIAIISWRDGQVCVMGSIDGSRCKNGLMWNHLIAQGQSAWLKWNLGNVFWGCGNHNLLDKYGDKVIAEWFVGVFGNDCLRALRLEATEAKEQKRKYKIYELEAMLQEYDELYQNRYFIKDAGDINEMVMLGYYGHIIKRVFLERKTA